LIASRDFSSSRNEINVLGAFFRNVAGPEPGGGEAAVYEENRRNGPSAGARMFTSIRASPHFFSGERRGERLGEFARSPYQGRRLPPAIPKPSRFPGQPAGRKDLPNISK
jgi:hypothetical protein